MSLIAFHKFLISTAIVFCVVFALRQLSEFKATGDNWVLLTAIAFGVAAAALGFYLTHLSGFLKIPTEDQAPALKLKSRRVSQNFLRPAESHLEAQAENLSPGNLEKNGHRIWEWVSSLTRVRISSSKKNGHDGNEPE